MGLKDCVLGVLWRTVFLRSLYTPCVWREGGSKGSKRRLWCIFPQQEGENLFPELFRGLMECTTAKDGGWDCAALSQRLTSLASKCHLFCSQGSSHHQKYFYITLKYLSSRLTLLQWHKLTQNVSQLDRLSLLPFAFFSTQQFLW